MSRAQGWTRTACPSRCPALPCNGTQLPAPPYVRGGLAQTAGPPLDALQRGRVHHKLLGGLVVHGHRLQAAHKGSVAQLSLRLRADDLGQADGEQGYQGG